MPPSLQHGLDGLLVTAGTRHVLDSVVPDVEDIPVEEPEPKKNPAAVALGRLGGLKGGKARAKKLTKKQRSEIARKAARARWKKS